MVCPFAGETELGHDPREVLHSERRIVSYPVVPRRPSIKIVGPFARVFYIVNIVSEPFYPKNEIQVIPGYTPQQSVLSDQASYNDAKGRIHNLAQIDLFFEL